MISKADEGMRMSRLEGKIALVTGGSLGFGAAIARRLAQEGAAVAVNYPFSMPEADAVVSQIKQSGGRAISVRADITKRDEVDGEDARLSAGRLVVLASTRPSISGAHLRRLSVRR